MATGKLPITGRVEIAFDPIALNYLASDTISEINTTGIIQLDDGRQAKIKIKMIRAIPPHNLQATSVCRVETNLESPAGYKRLLEWINQNLVDKNMWVIFGHTDGEVKIPLMFTYLAELDIFLYTQRLQTDDEQYWGSFIVMN